MARKIKTIVHVNQHIIRRNKTHGESEPPLSIRERGKTRRADEVAIHGADGEVAAKVVYSPDKPLSCGARVWIESVDGTIKEVA